MDNCISIVDYRAAVRRERELHFLCKDCCNDTPKLTPEDVEVGTTYEPGSIGMPIAESTVICEEQPPVLQRSMPVEEMDTTDDLQPPVLELSVPLHVADMGPPILQRSVPWDAVGDAMEDPSVLEMSAPLHEDSDIMNSSVYRSDTVVDTVVTNETYIVSRDSGEHTELRFADDASFDISHRDVDATDPIQEQPLDEDSILTETILEDTHTHTHTHTYIYIYIYIIKDNEYIWKTLRTIIKTI